jgi:chromosome segregation ATPase
LQTKEELERRARDTKQQIETLEEQLRMERERAKERERQHCAERDELFRGLKTTTSARNEEADRLKRYFFSPC